MGATENQYQKMLVVPKKYILAGVFHGQQGDRILKVQGRIFENKCSQEKVSWKMVASY